MLSVIIPTLNRAQLLKKALDSINAQELNQNDFEVLVIDNGSTDNTKEIVSQFKDIIKNIQYHLIKTPGLHNGRHAGLKYARGDILVYADDDIQALPTWLSAIQDAFQAPNTALVGGNNLPLFIDTPPKWLTQLWLKRSLRKGKSLPALSILELQGESRAFSPFLVWGCNFAIKKDVLLEAEGFNPDGVPDELIKYRGDGETYISDYISKSAMQCIFHPQASVYHTVTPERMTKKYFKKRGFNQGISDSFTHLRRGFNDSGFSILRIIKKAIQKVQDFILLDSDAKEALKLYQIGYSEGYRYHQDEYKNNPDIQLWVHKKNYLEEE